MCEDCKITTKKKMTHTKKKSHWQDYFTEEALLKDINYFKKQVEKGIERLAGKRTEENVRYCLHCKLWRKTDKFIEEIEKLK